jgi:hypothetical protein
MAWSLLLLVGCGRLGYGAGADPAALDSAVEDAPATFDDAPDASTDPSLVVHFRLDEAEGISVRDDAGGHDGTLIGDGSWQPRLGAIGGALSLEGGYVRVPWGPEESISNDLTAAAWVSIGAGSLPFGRYVASHYWNGMNNGSLNLNSSVDGEGLDCAAYIGGTWRSTPDVGGLGRGTWRHVACVYDGTSLTPYVDGVAQPGRTSSGAFAASEPRPLALGASILPDDTVQNRFQGRIDDVRIYSRALSPDELVALATRQP